MLVSILVVLMSVLMVYFGQKWTEKAHPTYHKTEGNLIKVYRYTLGRNIGTYDIYRFKRENGVIKSAETFESLKSYIFVLVYFNNLILLFCILGIHTYTSTQRVLIGILICVLLDIYVYLLDKFNIVSCKKYLEKNYK